MEEHVQGAIDEDFPCPRLREAWVAKAIQKIRSDGGLDPDDAWDVFIGRLSDLALNTPYSDSARQGSGLLRATVYPTMCRLLRGPVVLELVHMTEVGVSAFDLDRVRCRRDFSFHLQLVALDTARELATPDRLQEIRQGLDIYPRRCLRLYLSDGEMELEALELEPLNLRLGRTPMGLKIQLVNVPIIQGTAYLARDNVTILGGRSESLECAHQRRLASDLYTGMINELALAQEQGVSTAELFATDTVQAEAEAD